MAANSIADYEYTEQIVDLIHRSQKKQLGDTKELALASAHGLAFHRGLGEPVHPTSSVPLNKYLSHDSIGAYSTLAYQKSNVAIVGNGVEHSELSKWVGQYFRDLPTSGAPGLPPMEISQSKYYGGEERIAHGSGNTMVIAFPGSSSLTGGFYKPEISVLAALLGGKTTIKWSPGFSLLSKLAAKTPGLNVSTSSAIYSDAGLLYVMLDGSASAIRDAAGEVVSTLKKVSSGDFSNEDFEKARAIAKFKELEYGQDMMAGLELTGAGLVHGGKPYQLDESAKQIGEVTKEKVQEVCSISREQLQCSLAEINMCMVGRIDALRIQQCCLDGGRPLRAAVRRGDWFECVDERLAFSFRMYVYAKCTLRLSCHNRDSRLFAKLLYCVVV